MNTLTLPLIRYLSRDGTTVLATLPGVLSALMRDELVSFSALRPHQRHAWHAFLAQLGTIALLHAGQADTPEEEEKWRELLRGLTPSQSDDAPWCLVSPPHQPALLQPPLPRGDLSGLRNVITTPDGLDMLVTSKNHDLKKALMTVARQDDWLFALVTLQTMDGFLGAGNYGISRMNGGFANRPGLGLAPPGGPGAHLQRDIRRLLAMGGRPRLTESYSLDGLALLWLQPWDGATSLSRSQLHPLYIEVCRRVRLQDTNGRLVACAGGSKVARVAAVDGGVTGDPWTPVRRDKDGQKALAVDGRGFSYRSLVELLFPTSGDPSPLQSAELDDVPEGLILVARALVRGQGKTEGYHERRVLLSSRLPRGGVGCTRASYPIAQAAHDRVRLAKEMTGVLRFSLLALFENGPVKVNFDNIAAVNKAKSFLVRFERMVDLTFFEDLRAEVDRDGQEARDVARTAWARGLLTLAEGLLAEADSAGSKATNRRYRARIAAQNALQGGTRRNEYLSSHMPQSLTPEEAPMPPNPAPAQLPGPTTLPEVVNGITAMLDPDRIGTGALAALRRLDPGGPLTEPALLRLLVQYVPEHQWVGAEIRRWSLIVHALALAAPGLHRGRGKADRFGRALFEAGFSELRLGGLLRARPDELLVAIPRAVRFLVSKGRRFDPVPLARFVHGAWAGSSRSDEQREAIARDYFRAEWEAGKAV